uniref:Uncharacterized protein n=1 Tax=Callorhinchus milii TaxID=7868 RepID=A0A4W3HWX0_CALMI
CWYRHYAFTNSRKTIKELHRNLILDFSNALAMYFFCFRSKQYAWLIYLERGVQNNIACFVQRLAPALLNGHLFSTA